MCLIGRPVSFKCPLADSHQNHKDELGIEDFISFSPFFLDLHEHVVSSNPLSTGSTPLHVAQRRYTLSGQPVPPTLIVEGD